MYLKQRDLVQQIQERNPELTYKQIMAVYQSLFDVMMDAVADGYDVRIKGFGKFYPSLIPKKTVYNLYTKDPILVPEQMRPRFKAGKTFNQLVSGK